MFKKILLTLFLIFSLATVGLCAGKGTNFNEADTASVLNYIFNQQADFDDVVIEKTLNFAVDAESTDTYVISLARAPAAYTAGMIIIFDANTANTGACTVNVNGLGAKSLKSLNNQDPADNYIEAGSIVVAVYDGTNFQIIEPDANP